MIRPQGGIRLSLMDGRWKGSFELDDIFMALSHPQFFGLSLVCGKKAQSKNKLEESDLSCGTIGSVASVTTGPKPL